MPKIETLRKRRYEFMQLGRKHGMYNLRLFGRGRAAPCLSGSTLAYGDARRLEPHSGTFPDCEANHGRCATQHSFSALCNAAGLSLAAVGLLPPILAAAAQSIPGLGLANSARLIRQGR